MPFRRVDLTLPIRTAPLALWLCAGLTFFEAGAQPVPTTSSTSAATSAATTAGRPATASTAPAGMVKRLTGTVTLERAGALLPVQPGTPVRVGDTLRTGPDGAVGVTLADDTLLSAGPNGEWRVSGFDFNATTQDGSLLVSLWRGTLGMVTGLIGKKSPEKVTVQTRTVVLGVRGTEFIVDAHGDAR